MAAQDPPTTSICSTCSARLRPGELWCSLCHTPIRAGSPAPGPAPVPVPLPAPVPAPRPAPASTAGPLVGGQLPPHVLARLDAGLAAIADHERVLRTDNPTLRVVIGALRGRPALAAAVAGAGVLVVLLLTMWIIGRVV